MSGWWMVHICVMGGCAWKGAMIQNPHNSLLQIKQTAEGGFKSGGRSLPTCFYSNPWLWANIHYWAEKVTSFFSNFMSCPLLFVLSSSFALPPLPSIIQQLHWAFPTDLQQTFLHHIPVLDVVIYSKIFQNWRYTFKLTEHSSV